MKDFSSIYEEYFIFIYKYLYSLCLNADLAEELTQETFFKAVLKINTFKEDSKITTWLCSIARNLYLNYRKKQTKIISDDYILNNLTSVDNIEYNYITKEEHKIIKQKIKLLDDISQKVIYFRIYGNMNFKEIGNIFHKSDNWARVTFYRAKNKLKEGEIDE